MHCLLAATAEEEMVYAHTHTLTRTHTHTCTHTHTHMHTHMHTCTRTRTHAHTHTHTHTHTQVARADALFELAASAEEEMVCFGMAPHSERKFTKRRVLDALDCQNDECAESVRVLYNTLYLFSVWVCVLCMCVSPIFSSSPL